MSIQKGCNRGHLSTYRPVSVASTAAKICEMDEISRIQQNSDIQTIRFRCEGHAQRT